MAEDLRDLVRTERLALIELLETLTARQWATPSLCAGWTVQDVAAHLAWAPAEPARELLIGLARAGFRPNRFNADSARRWSRRGPPAIIDQLRRNAAEDAKPVGVPRTAALVDAVAHGLDIRRPLGVPHAVAPEAFRALADFTVGSRWPATVLLGGSVRRRIAGLRLVADGADWSYGTGPEVHGSTAALALMLLGRPVAPEELTGPGAGTLHRRLARPPGTGGPEG